MKSPKTNLSTSAATAHSTGVAADAATPVGRQPPSALRKTKYSFAFPAALRITIDRLASESGVRSSVIVAASLKWFAFNWEDTGSIPTLIMIDPENLPIVSTTFPDTYSVSLPSDVMAAIDTMATIGAGGTNRSEVVRYAVCAYFEEAAFSGRDCSPGSHSTAATSAP